MVRLANWLFHARKARDRFFHPGLFGEAAWDVLLALYMMDQAGPRLTIAALSKIARVPTATILRWLQTLEDQALVMRRPHPHDRRSALVQITPHGRAAMESYLSETLASSA
jgi:DNA-binding MarR family transcriptional regulator